ncbi:MAG: hypothetical protein KZQ83_14540 [gamma proteobacterium symbiont of Taylorina sp.]|nr:hypothetical protein [gamma proteobacterium symbiont of Taylorina sp.]
MNLREYHYFYSADGLYLPDGSYIVEEISSQQMKSLLKDQNQKTLNLQNYSYQTHINSKILK